MPEFIDTNTPRALRAANDAVLEPEDLLLLRAINDDLWPADDELPIAESEFDENEWQGVLPALASIEVEDFDSDD